MSDNLFDTIVEDTVTDKPPFRQAPAGDYLATVRTVKKIRANTGTQGLELQFTLQDFVGKDDPDMEGVDLSRCRLRDTLYVTENTVGFVTEKLVRISKEMTGQKLADALEILPGAEVVVRLKQVTQDRNGAPLKTPRLEVVNYYSTDWYFKSDKAAA